MPIALSDENYSEFITALDKALFIDFYSPSCGPCQEVLSRLVHLEDYFKDEAVIATVDVTQNPRLAKKYAIVSVPFCVTISPKDKMIKDYELGSASVDRYIRMIQKAQGKSWWRRIFGA